MGFYCFPYGVTIGTTGPNKVKSLSDFFFVQLGRELGKREHLNIWFGNAHAQFKECFFITGLYSTKGAISKGWLRFVLHGHTYSVCDRRFGSIQTLFERHDVIDIPSKWETVLEQGELSNVRVYRVALDMTKDCNSFLRLQYVNWNTDLEKRYEATSIDWPGKPT